MAKISQQINMALFALALGQTSLVAQNNIQPTESLPVLINIGNSKYSVLNPNLNSKIIRSSSMRGKLQILSFEIPCKNGVYDTYTAECYSDPPKSPKNKNDLFNIQLYFDTLGGIEWYYTKRMSIKNKNWEDANLFIATGRAQNGSPLSIISTIFYHDGNLIQLSLHKQIEFPSTKSYKEFPDLQNYFKFTDSFSFSENNAVNN